MWRKLFLSICAVSAAGTGLERLDRRADEDRNAPPNGAVRVEADTGLSLELNVPAFRLDVRDGGRIVRSYSIAVGMPAFRTPRGSFFVTDIEWNPWWNPPESEWARDEKRTPPGPANPMGKVKMNFSPYYFLHGTPLESSLGSASSHGCIRMRSVDATDLALLLHARDAEPVSRVMLDSLIANRQTRRFVLRRPVPITLGYALIEWARDTLFLYPDVYRLEHGNRLDQVWESLLRNGTDTGSVRKAVLVDAIRRVRRTRVAIPRDSLFER